MRALPTTSGRAIGGAFGSSPRSTGSISSGDAPIAATVSRFGWQP